jgi:hypothetical protein
MDALAGSSDQASLLAASCSLDWPAALADIGCVISGFRRDGDEICALLKSYAVLRRSSVTTFKDNLSVSSSRVKKSQKKWLSRNIGTGLPLNAAQYCRRAQISSMMDVFAPISNKCEVIDTNFSIHHVGFAYLCHLNQI